MRKAKEEQIMITHVEIIGFAIKTVSEQWQKEVEMLKKVGESPASSVWKNKLKALLALYKLETGNDYGYDFGDDLKD